MPRRMKPCACRYKALAEQRNRPLGSITKRWLAGLGLSAGIGLMPAAPHAEPQGGEVVSGGPVSIEVQHREEFSHFTHIETTSQRTHMRWQSFDIGATEGVYFQQPTEASMVWNSVLDPKGTTLNGFLGSNGGVGVSNPAGLFIGGQAVFDVGDFIAAAGELAPEAFEAGELHFTNTGALEVEQGAEIRADSVALIGRHVANHGSVVADDGSIAMLAGDEVWIGEHGSPVRIHMTGIGEGRDELQPGVMNSGTLSAARGAVRLAAGDLLAMAVRNTGDIAAQEISIEGGEEGLVALSGTLTARHDDGRRGGSIEVTGDWIALQGATLDASGTEEGGTILVGGEAGGQGETPTARGVHADRDTTIRADALEEGDGGEIVLWGDEVLQVYADLSARGGTHGGDGGFIETSSPGTLVAAPHVDVSAPQGEAGEWLIDPIDVTIKESVEANVLEGLEDESGGVPFEIFQPETPDSEIATASIVGALERGSNVTVTTTPPIAALGDQEGHIRVEDRIQVGRIQGAANVTLSLLADADITLEEEASITRGESGESFENGLDVFLQADGDVVIGADIETGGGNVGISGDNVTIGAKIQDEEIVLIGDVEINTTYYGTQERSGGDVTLLAAIHDNPDDGGNITLNARVTTGGGDFFNLRFDQSSGAVLPGGTTFTSTDLGVIDTSQGEDAESDGTISIFEANAVDIGADLTSEEIGLHAGYSGSGDLDIAGRVLTANQIFLAAGDPEATTAGPDAPRIESSGALFTSLDDPAAAPEVFGFRQGAPVTDGDIPALDQFGDQSLTDLGSMDYTIGSFGAGVSLETASKVLGSNLTLFGEGDLIDSSIDDETGECQGAVCIDIDDVVDNRFINPQTVTISVSGNFQVSDDLASQLRPLGDGTPLTSAITLHAGSDGKGDLSFDSDVPVTLKADRITLRAGSGTGEHDTATVHSVNASNSPKFQAKDDDTSPTEFTIWQDAEIFDENQDQVAGTTIPDANQFGTNGVGGMDYTLRSDAGDIRIALNATAAALGGANLALLTAGVIDVADPGLTTDISVGTLELGGVGDFTVTGDVLAKFTVTGDEITLRSGAGRDGDLSFESGVEVNADDIWLVAGNEDLGTAGSIFAGEPEDAEEEDSFELPSFGNSAADGAPKTFVFQQTNAITQDQLPSGDQFQTDTGGEVTIEKYAIRSAGLFSSEIQIGRLQDLDALLAAGTGKLIFSSPEITIERSDAEGNQRPDLVLDERHELRGDDITLATRKPPDISWGDPPVVDASKMGTGTINGFDEGEFDLTAAPGTSPLEFTIDQLGGFRVDPDTGVSDTLPNWTAFGDGLAPADRDPVRYTLISREGTRTCDSGCKEEENWTEIGIEIDPDKVAGTDLVLRLGGRTTGIEDGDPGEDFQNVGTIDFGSSPLIVNSLDARTARDFAVNGDGPIAITAEKSIQLWAGGTVEDTDLETSIGVGDLSFGTDVTLTAQDITLKAGFGDDNSVVYARDDNTEDPSPSFILVPANEGDKTSFTLESTGSIRNFFGSPPTGDDDPGKYSEAPLTSQFSGDKGEGLQNADTFQLTSLAGEIEINVPSEVGIGAEPDDEDEEGQNRNKPGHLILRAPTITLEEQRPDEDLGNLVLEDVTLKGDSITLSASVQGRVVDAHAETVRFESFSNFYKSPSSFTIRQNSAVSDSSLLPLPSQFGGNLEETTYTVQSDLETSPGDRAVVITVDSTFAERVARSKLVLQASDGNHIAIEDLGNDQVKSDDDVEVDLDLVSLTLNPETDEDLMSTMEFQVGKANIKTDEPQVYSNPVILTGGTARFEATGVSVTDELGWPHFQASITFEERIDGTVGGPADSLLIHARDRVTFHKNIGEIAALDTFQINLEQQEIDIFNPYQIIPTPTVEFGPELIEGEETFLVRARQILLNPNPERPYDNPGHRRARVPQTATFFRRQGDLHFEAGAPGQGGIFEMGQNEKLSVADGNLVIDTYGGIDSYLGGQGLPEGLGPGESASDYGQAFIGDLSASGRLGEAGRIEVQAGVIHMLRREAGDVLRANGRVVEDAGVDYVANEIDFDFVVEGGDASATLEKNQRGPGRRARFAIAESTAAPDWMERFPVADIKYNNLATSGSDAVLDGVPDGTPRADISPALSEVVPLPDFRPPPSPEPVEPTPLTAVGIRTRPVSNAEYRAWRSGAAIYDDLGAGLPPGGPQVTAVEARLVADEAARAAVLYDQVFGADGSRAPDIRATLQKAVDDYRSESHARRVVGFELRRYLNNRPSTQFQAYRTLQDLDALFGHHRRSGLTPPEYRGIQRTWLEDIKPDGISLDEFAELIHPSRYVRGSDVLDIFGE